MLSYHGSTSQAAAEICFKQLREKYGYPTVNDAFDDRHFHREEWASIIWEYNQPDGLTLYRDILNKGGNILNGVRRAAEIQALRQALLVDLVIWIDRNVPKDPSLEMEPGIADIIIPNNGSLDNFYQRLSRLARCLKILK